MSWYHGHSEAGAILEQLEPRQLMTVLIDGGPVTFTELDGDMVTVTLKGQGTGDVELHDASSSDSYIDVTGTNSASTLTVNIKRGPEGDGMALFRWIKVDGDLKALTAPGVWLSDVNIQDVPSVEITGWLGSISLFSVNAGSLSIGGQPDNSPVTMTFKSVLGVDTLDSGTPVKSITAASTWNVPDARAQWTAPSFGAITMKSYQADGFSGGDLFADITATAGGIGDIKLTYGSLAASLSAQNGAIGNISTSCGYSWDKEGEQGLVWGGDIDVDIQAGRLKGKSVGNITAAGTLSVAIDGEGSVGNLTATGKAYKAGVDYDTGKAYNEYHGADVELDIAVPDDASVGAVKATGGNVMAAIQAGVIGAVTVQGVLCNGEMFGGNLDATLTAAHTTGALSTTGGDLNAVVAAYEGIGKISGKAVTQNAAIKWFSEPGFEGEPASRWWEETTPSAVWGSAVNVTISLGIDPKGLLSNNASARFGGIAGTGMDVNVDGEVAAPLRDAVVAQITSKTMSYTPGYEDKYNNDGDVVGAQKLAPEVIGGNVNVENLLEV